MQTTQSMIPKRSRKLLLKKRELSHLVGVLDQKQRTLIPLQFELQGKRIKLVFGVGKGLKKFEKREKKKLRDIDRSIERELRH